MNDTAVILKIKGVLIFLLLIFAHGAIAGEVPEKKIKGPVFQLEDHQPVIGPVLEGVPVSYQLKIRNRGDALLKLEQFRIWKGSKIINAPREIRPGEVKILTLSLQTLGAGKKALRGVTILTNEPRKSKFHRIGCDLLITPQIDTVPDRFFLNGLEGSELKADLRIKGNLKSGLLLALHEEAPDKRFIAELIRDKNSGAYHLSIRNLQKEPGSYRGRIVLKTNYPDKPFMVVPVFTRVLSKIEITPGEIDFGRVVKSRYLKPGQGKEKQASQKHSENPVRPVFIRINTDEPLKISGIFFEWENDFLSSNVKMIETDRVCRIDVTALVEKLPVREIHTVLVIKTDQAGYESIRVPVKIRVQSIK